MVTSNVGGYGEDARSLGVGQIFKRVPRDLGLHNFTASQPHSLHAEAYQVKRVYVVSAFCGGLFKMKSPDANRTKDYPDLD
jgi:hypothetical protein